MYQHSVSFPITFSLRYNHSSVNPSSYNPLSSTSAFFQHLYCLLLLAITFYQLSTSILSTFAFQDTNETPGVFGSTLGVDLCRGRRRHSGTLQLPPLSWRQAERDLSRAPEGDTMARPTTLPFHPLPQINIIHADPDRLGQKLADTAVLENSSCASLLEVKPNVFSPVCIRAFYVHVLVNQSYSILRYNMCWWNPSSMSLEWHSGLRHCISVLEASLQTLVRFLAVSQSAVIGSPIGRRTIGPESLGFGREKAVIVNKNLLLTDLPS